MTNGDVARQLRAEFDTILIKIGCTGNRARLHVDDGGTALCENADGQTIEGLTDKSIDVYPPGYTPWCVRCAREFTGDYTLEGEVRHPGIAADGGEP